MKLPEPSLNAKIIKGSDEMKLPDYSNAKIAKELDEMKSPESSNPKITIMRNRNQVCRFCGKFFQKNASLSWHINTVHIWKHKCDTCGKSFPIASKLKDHLPTCETHNKFFKCDDCGKSFSSKSKIEIHVKIIHTSDKADYKYDLHDKKFSSKSIVKNHIKEVYDDIRIHKCDNCSKSFSQKSHLKRHNQIVNCNNKIQVKHEILRDNKCGMCGKVLSKQIKLKKHMEISHDNKCDHCEKAFPFLGMLKTHIWTVHEGHKEKTCNLCDKSLSKQIKLKKHMEISHDNKCDHCEKAFPFLGMLKTHIWTVHEGHKEKTCNLCGKSLSKQIKLEKHLEISHGHKCGNCKKAFPIAQMLKTHIWTVHEGNEEKTCNLCGKSLSKQIKLEKHLEILHDHKCENCKKSFPSVQKLKEHNLEIHKSEKKLIKCDVCYKFFVHKSALKNHIMVDHLFNLQKHLEISQDHKSDDGEKSFPIAQTLNKHTERQSEKELIKCDLCGKVFRRSSLKNQKSALKNHIMVEHPINLFEFKQDKDKLEKIEIKQSKKSKETASGSSIDYTIKVKSEPIELKPKIFNQEHKIEYWSEESNNMQTFDCDPTIEIKMEPIG